MKMKLKMMKVLLIFQIKIILLNALELVLKKILMLMKLWIF